MSQNAVPTKLRPETEDLIRTLVWCQQDGTPIPDKPTDIAVKELMDAHGFKYGLGYIHAAVKEACARSLAVPVDNGDYTFPALTPLAKQRLRLPADLPEPNINRKPPKLESDSSKAVLEALKARPKQTIQEITTKLAIQGFKLSPGPVLTKVSELESWGLVHGELVKGQAERQFSLTKLGEVEAKKLMAKRSAKAQSKDAPAVVPVASDSELQILRFVSECGGDCTTEDIAEELGVTRSTAAEKLKKICDKGLLVRSITKSGPKTNLHNVTSAGQAEVDRHQAKTTPST